MPSPIDIIPCRMSNEQVPAGTTGNNPRKRRKKYLCPACGKMITAYRGKSQELVFFEHGKFDRYANEAYWLN